MVSIQTSKDERKIARIVAVKVCVATYLHVSEHAMQAYTGVERHM